MKEGLMKKIYDNVDNQWVFIMKATENYNKEFRKTAKIGEPPKIDDVIEKMFDKTDEEKKQNAQETDSDSGDKKEEKTEEKKDKKESKSKDKKEDSS